MMLNCPWMFFLANPIGPTACVCVKREKCVPFDERLKWLVDDEWYYRLLKTCKATACGLSVLSFFGHEEQITKTLDLKETERADMNALREIYRSMCE